jgi:hypothetical protein
MLIARVWELEELLNILVLTFMQESFIKIRVYGQ